MMIKDTSPFDIPTHIRTKLFFMQTAFIVAFGLAMVGLKSLTALTSISILLVYFTFSDKLLGPNVVFAFTAIAGMIFLANPFSIFIEGVNQTLPVFCLGLAVFLIVVGRILCGHIKQSLPLSTGTFLFNFSTLLIVPAFMIVAFSIESSNVDYGTFEMIYFVVNGIITWLALYLIIQVFQQDRSNYLEVIGYSAFVYVVIYQFLHGQVQIGGTDQESPVVTDPNTPPSDGTTPSPDVITPTTLGIWEYVGLFFMVGLRFCYSIYR